jgi:hypothetical protein
MKTSKQAILATFGIIVPAAAVVGACQVLVGLDKPVDEPAEDPCALARPPMRPPGTSATPRKMQPMAVRSLYFGGRFPEGPFRDTDGGLPKVASPLLGESFPPYDLDNVCTCDKRRGVKYGGNASCTVKGKDPACDGNGGADNGFAQVLKDNSYFDIDKELGLNKAFEDGTIGLTAMLLDYNGMRSDDSVQVAFLAASRFRISTAGYRGSQGSIGADTFCQKKYPDVSEGSWLAVDKPKDKSLAFGKTPPRWDGCDLWRVPNEPGNPNRLDDVVGHYNLSRTIPGYVRDGRIYAGSDGTSSEQIPIAFPGSSLSVGGGIVQGDIIAMDVNGNKLELTDNPADAAKLYRIGVRGTVTGRVSLDKLLRSIGLIYQVRESKRICATSNPTRTILDLFRIKLCGGRDIMATRVGDNQGKLCDAISISIGFDAYPAYIEPEDAVAQQLQPGACDDVFASIDGKVDAGINDADAISDASDAGDADTADAGASDGRASPPSFIQGAPPVIKPADPTRDTLILECEKE